MNDDRKLLTSYQIGRAIGLSRSTVMRHAKAGIIPSIRIGRVLRFELAEVMAALKGGAK